MNTDHNDVEREPILAFGEPERGPGLANWFQVFLYRGNNGFGRGTGRTAEEAQANANEIVNAFATIASQREKIERLEERHVSLRKVLCHSTKTETVISALGVVREQQRAINEILAEAEFVGDTHAPFTTWVAGKCRAALAKERGKG